MHKLRLRTYSLLGLGLLLLLPWLFFVAAFFIMTQSLHIREDRPDSYAVPMAAAFGGLLVAFVIIGLRMRGLLLKPLEGLGLAARKVAGGKWDVELPQSAIREIADVRDGFERMVSGLQDSQGKQAKLEEERRFIIAAVAHDLRTPLFALRGYLDGLEQGIAQTPEQISKYVAVCKQKSAQLDRLVEDLFTFAKMEYQEAELSKNAANFGDIIQKSIESLEPQADVKQISILAQSVPNDYVIRADSHLLERAISNLLDNAVRHTPEDGRILLQYWREQDRVSFTIHDSGLGFTLEEQEQVFEPLYRGEKSRNRATGGAGLGLTISRRIIRQHGGELAAANHPAGGAILSGWIPAERNG
ncbi:HAMP domain-containing histidine kinase [Paenibacillus glycanilyticus]|uniref:sensor histidine kinase n=1 Tax=Paenibacillus glycanilyticus TaxID=126569 RepID=UPI00203A7C14|nr:HAMP domain-containing sensor histidine kinase [Paenibacillus glycanilyticus]MCM3627734.1 HAMP domain-containing histidine kinase [Paenibacillus glycanilyticus]